jgi:hypothetical protein
MQEDSLACFVLMVKKSKDELDFMVATVLYWGFIHSFFCFGLIS